MGSEIHYWVCSVCVVNGTINDATLYVPVQHVRVLKHGVGMRAHSRWLTNSGLYYRLFCPSNETQ